MIRIDSPVIAEWEELFEKRGEQRGKVQGLRQAILNTLDIRFGPVPEDLRGAVLTLVDPVVLTDLQRFSVNCPDLESFRLRLSGHPSN